MAGILRLLAVQLLLVYAFQILPLSFQLVYALWLFQLLFLAFQASFCLLFQQLLRILLAEALGLMKAYIEIGKAILPSLEKLYGEKFDPSRHTLNTPIKAATYHMLKIERGGTLRVQLIFDA